VLEGGLVGAQGPQTLGIQSSGARRKLPAAWTFGKPPDEYAPVVKT